MVSWGLKYAGVTTFCSLAVLRCGFVKLYNLVHCCTGLTLLVHFLGVMVDHLVSAMAGYSLSLTVGVASFQKVEGEARAALKEVGVARLIGQPVN